MNKALIIACCGMVLIGAGLTIHYHIGKRRFERRNWAGLPQLPNYRRAVWINFWERCAMILANLSTMAGGLCLTAAGIDHLTFKT